MILFGLEELDRFPYQGLEIPNHDLRMIEWGETGSFPEGQGFVMLKCHWPAAGKEDWMMFQAGSKQCTRICGLQMPLTCLREVELGKGCPFHRVQRLQGQCSTPISGIRVGCLWSSSKVGEKNDLSQREEWMTLGEIALLRFQIVLDVFKGVLVSNNSSLFLLLHPV